MKTFKDFLLEKGISEEEFAKKSVEEMAQLQSEYSQAIISELKEQVENAVTKEALEDIKNTLENIKSDKVSSEELTAIKGVVEAQGNLITKMQDKGSFNREEVEKSLKDQIVEQLKADKDAFNELKNVKGAKMHFTIKAAGTMLTSTNLTPSGNRIARTETEAGRVGFVRRMPFILDLVTVQSTNAKNVFWVEMVNEDGTVAMTAEGAVKSQIDWDYVEASERVKKVTAFTKASKEMLDDVDGFAGDIAAEITERIKLFLDSQVLTGDGTGENLVGIATNATAFAAGNLADTVDSANDSDALRAAIAQVVRSEFYPTAIVINPDKAAAMDLQKATDGHYILPPFQTADGMKIKGIPVVENTGVAADAFYVGDFSKFKVKIREEINIQIGYDGDDWTKNLVTPLGEMRAVSYIPANHYGAIVAGTFTAAKAALETP
jgi:hypothetical protein